MGGGTNRPVTANVIFCHYDLFQISGEGHARAMGHICYKGDKLNRNLYFFFTKVLILGFFSPKYSHTFNFTTGSIMVRAETVMLKRLKKWKEVPTNSRDYSNCASAVGPFRCEQMASIMLLLPAVAGVRSWQHSSAPLYHGRGPSLRTNVHLNSPTPSFHLSGL